MNGRSAKEQGAKNLDEHLRDKKNGGKLSPQEEKLSGEHGGNGKGETNNGYYTDKYGRWHRQNGQYASNKEVELPEPSTRKGSGKGGRLGNESTRAQNKQIGDYLESHGYTITGGGGRTSEEYLSGPGNGKKGSWDTY